MSPVFFVYTNHNMYTIQLIVIQYVHELYLERGGL